MNAQPTILLPITEAAQMLGVHSDTVRRMAAQGIIPARKFGRQWRIHRAAFEAWIDKAYGVKKGGKT